MNVSRMRYLCGIVHRTGSCGTPPTGGDRRPTVYLRRFRRGFLTRHATPAATRWSPTLGGTGVLLAATHGPSADTRLPGIMPALIGGGAGEGLA